ncbi:hypothetical protein [Novipirellula maiorica]|nr:hypothetical protein [Rhodopirellula maiorica]
MRPIITLLFAAVWISTATPSTADEQLTLMSTILQWQYPHSKLSGSVMSDAATVNADGKRTIASLVCKTTMTTEDSVEKVIAFYKTKLTPNPKADDKTKAEWKDGQCVLISDESAGRPLALHTILVTAKDTSTTLTVSRGKDETETHINWKHYVRL